MISAKHTIDKVVQAGLLRENPSLSIFKFAGSFKKDNKHFGPRKGF